jgi:hypothetical protein
MTEWMEWHRGYEDPDSNLSRRLSEVRQQIGSAFDRARPGPIRFLSLCAGAGLDVLPVLAEHPRAADVTGALVELDPALTGLARAAAPPSVDVVQGDAGNPSVFAGFFPADVLLLCGIFGNIADHQVRQLINAIPHLLAVGGTVLWTRHREAPDLTPTIRDWLSEVGVTESAFIIGEPPAHWSVGAGVRTLEVAVAALPDQLFSFSTRPSRQDLG